MAARGAMERAARCWSPSPSPRGCSPATSSATSSTGSSGASVRGTRGAWGVLTRDLVGRRDAFRLAVLAAFAPFYNSAAYRPGSLAQG